MTRGKRRRLVPSSSVRKRKKIDWTERLIRIIQKYPLKIPSRNVSEQQKKDYRVLNNFKERIFRKKLKGKLPEELIEASKKCPWFIPYFYPIDWIERIKNIILKYPLKPPSQYVSEEQKDYEVLKNYKYFIFRKRLKGKLPEKLIRVSKDCPWFIPFFYPVKVDWTERIKGIIQKYPSKIPSEAILEQKKDHEIFINFKQGVFKKKLKGKLPEELIKVSKDSSWFLLWILS